MHNYQTDSQLELESGLSPIILEQKAVEHQKPFNEKKLIKALWVKHHKIATASQHAVYLLLMGKDIKKSFSPLKKESKIMGVHGNVYINRDKALMCVKNREVHSFFPFKELLGGVDIKYGRYDQTSDHHIFMLTSGVMNNA